MCGRYRRTTQEEELARLYHIPIPKLVHLARVETVDTTPSYRQTFKKRCSLIFSRRVLRLEKRSLAARSPTPSGMKDDASFAELNHDRDQ